MDYTQVIGNVNELKCILAIMLLGYECSIPYGNGAKYDFIADINGELLRFQCKSSTQIIDDPEAFIVHTSCQTVNTKLTKRYLYSFEQIDYFITSYLDKIYVIPVEECSSTKTLRLSPPRNNSSVWNNANDYLLSNYFTYNEHYILSRLNFLNRENSSANKITNSESSLKKLPVCKLCGMPVSKDGNLCVNCARIQSRKVQDRPSRQELKDLIRSESFLAISKKYGVSDNAIRRWCRSYNLPTKAGDIKRISDKDWINT